MWHPSSETYVCRSLARIVYLWGWLFIPPAALLLASPAAFVALKSLGADYAYAAIVGVCWIVWDYRKGKAGQ